MTIKGYLCYNIERKERRRLVMVASILERYISIYKEDEIESAEDYAVFLTEQEVIKSVENSGRELSESAVRTKLQFNCMLSLRIGRRLQGTIQDKEVRTYDELYEFINNYVQQEEELDVYADYGYDLDSYDNTFDFGDDDIEDESVDEDGNIISGNNGEEELEADREHDLGTSLNEDMFVTFDEEGAIEPEDLIEPEPSNLVIRRRGSDEEVTSQPTQQPVECEEEDAKIEEYLQDNMLMMSYFGNVPQTSQVVRDREGNFQVDYSVLIGITYTSERKPVSFLAQTMEDAIRYLLSEGYEYNKNHNIFILKEQEEIVSYARIFMDMDLRGVMDRI